MMVYQREYLTDELIRESYKMQIAHNREVKGEFQLKMDWPRYRILEDHGGFVVYGVRDDSVLVGYACFIISKETHNTDKTTAYQDNIYVKPEYRKKGVGIKLLKYTEKSLKKFGVTRLSHMVMDAVDFSKVLQRQGFKSIGHIWAKEI